MYKYIQYFRLTGILSVCVQFLLLPQGILIFTYSKGVQMYAPTSVFEYFVKSDKILTQCA